jgi:methyltransferase (TIGR00027 family)
MGSAVLRAMHRRHDPAPWVLEDTVSEELLSPEERSLVEAEIARWAPEVQAGFRIAHAVRTRLAEDLAVAGLGAGRSTYVLLGAGLDTFAWRHPRAAELSVWEIDHPATQGWKRAALARAGRAEPPNVTFVPLDLSQASLRGLALASPATWSWMGVSMYLTPEVAAATLAAMARYGPGTTLAANFLLSHLAGDRVAERMQMTSEATVRAVGEPVVARYDPEEFKAMLHTAGFHRVELLDGATLSRRYLGGRPGVVHPASTMIAVAEV